MEMLHLNQILPEMDTKADRADQRKMDLVRVFVHGDGRRINPDRRKKSIPVTVERRSGHGRRSQHDRRDAEIDRRHRDDRRNSRPVTKE